MLRMLVHFICSNLKKSEIDELKDNLGDGMLDSKVFTSDPYSDSCSSSMFEPENLKLMNRKII